MLLIMRMMTKLKTKVFLETLRIFWLGMAGNERCSVKDILLSLPVEEAALLTLSLVTAATQGSLLPPSPPLPHHYHPLPPLLTPPLPAHPPGSQGALTLIGGVAGVVRPE